MKLRFLGKNVVLFVDLFSSFVGPTIFRPEKPDLKFSKILNQVFLAEKWLRALDTFLKVYLALVDSKLSVLLLLKNSRSFCLRKAFTPFGVGYLLLATNGQRLN